MIPLATVLLAFCASESSSRVARSGGFPKFPTPGGIYQSFSTNTPKQLPQTCGSRAIPWRPEREPRVVGGEVPPYGAIPWLVELRRGLEHQCGGAVVSRRLVLTAAHCWTDGLTAVAGAHGPPGSTPYEQSVKVERAILHPQFRQEGPYSHDIAILLLAAPGLYLNPLVKPACFSDESPPPGTWCEVSGWGAINPSEPDQLSSVLRSAAVPLIPLETCRKDGIYGGRQQPILDSMLCAGHLTGGVDACGGDSGGPLVCERNGRHELTGIVSWGDGCAKRDRPGVYTRVSSFLPWIRQAARELGTEYGY